MHIHLWVLHDCYQAKQQTELIILEQQEPSGKLTMCRSPTGKRVDTPYHSSTLNLAPAMQKIVQVRTQIWQPFSVSLSHRSTHRLGLSLPWDHVLMVERACVFGAAVRHTMLTINSCASCWCISSFLSLTLLVKSLGDGLATKVTGDGHHWKS